MSYQDNYLRWLNYEGLDPTLKAELLSMRESEKKEAFSLPLEFGTGGLRGLIGAGTNRLNIYTIAKTTIGFMQFLKHKYEQNRVVISYDNRKYSFEFALLAARILNYYDIETYLYDCLMPTPLLSYAVCELKATGGIMITASHNPKEYNGFKVYDNEGCQLLPEDADLIIKYINEIESEFEFEIAPKSPLFNFVPRSVIDSYIKGLGVLNYFPNLEHRLKTVFSPLHGTASSIIEEVYRHFNFDLYPVKAEMEPSSTFGNIPYPNPEDKAVFKESLKLAKEVNANLCIATDPDSDRIGVVVINGDQTIYLDGNETATLMFNFLVEHTEIKPNSYLFTTIVSSYLPLAIASDHNINSELVLTGFKYIGNKIKEVTNNGGHFLFGFEESYGSLLLDTVRDKDAIMASIFITLIANYYLVKEGKTLDVVLKEIYLKYGFYKNDIITLTIPGLDGITKMNNCLAKLRACNFNLPSFSLLKFSDYLKSESVDLVTKEVTRLNTPKSDVLKFNLNNDFYFIVRRSGTEPKLKIYLGGKDKTEEALFRKLETLKSELNTLINSYLGF